MPALQVGINADVSATGDAQVAGVSSAFAIFSNPAGIATVSPEGSRNGAGLAHHIWVGDLRTYALAGKLGYGANSAFGFFVLASDDGGSESTGQAPSPAGTEQFISVGAAYSRRFGQLQVGTAAKFLSERIGGNAVRGYGLDAGVQARLFGNSLELGGALLNLGRLSEVSGVVTDVPTALRGGVTVYPFRVVSTEDGFPLLNAYVAAEVSHVFPDHRTRLHVGAAGEVLEVITVRVGYVANDELRSVTAGIGLQVSDLQFDYAAIRFAQGFGGPGHVLSLRYDW